MTVLETRARSTSVVHQTMFRVAVLLFALLYVVLLGGLSSLFGGTLDDPIHRVHHVGAVLFIGMLVAGLLAQLRAPERNIAAFQQAVMCVLAIQITNLIMGNPDNHGGNTGFLDPAFLIFLVPVVILVALHPSRSAVFRGGGGMSRTLPAITLAAAVPLAWYGIQHGLVQRHSWPPLADPHHQKWFMMAFLAFSMLLVGLVASIRAEGWWLPAWSTGIAAVALGMVSMLYPDLASSLGLIGGGVSVIGGAAFVAAAVWEVRRERRGSSQVWDKQAGTVR